MFKVLNVVLWSLLYCESKSPGLTYYYSWHRHDSYQLYDTIWLDLKLGADVVDSNLA